MKSFISALAVFVLLGVSGCSTDSGDDSGGSGADFDSTLYYTRTQVDDLLKYAVQFWPANGTESTITQAGFANGVSLTFPASNVSGLVLEVYVKNTSGSSKTIGLALTGTNSPGSGGAYVRTLPDGGYSKEFVFYPAWSSTGGGTIVVWQDTAQADGTAASSLAGLEIKVNVIYWVKSVK